MTNVQAPGPVTAGPGAPSAERLTATVAALAAPEFTGRRTGTPGGRSAREYLAGQLRQARARASLEEFAVPAVRELYATPAAVWTTPDGASHTLAHRRDFAEHLATADVPGLRPGPLAAGTDPGWTGRWVLVPALTPEVISQAQAAGAGLLVPRGTDEAGWMPKMIAGPATAPVPILGIRHDLHQRMLAERGELSASAPVRTVAVTGTNVHGVLADPAPGGVSVLLTAHYDGVGDDPQQRFPAAGDNASGCAVILEAARILASVLPAGTGLAVAFLDAEEAGAWGSAHHAPQVTAGTYVINVDGAAELADAAAVEAGARPGRCWPRSTRQGGRRECRYGQRPCPRTTAATPPPGCPRQGSEWECPATRPPPRRSIVSSRRPWSRQPGWSSRR
ncbi:M28 family peptidase [Longispora albida]|uniref:M28 family peptidase n=1 Tax=Longispora albida TaxID=203523 RepID=UPI0003A33118|nr:M28 family peptidase [Longispora albida]